ncbi:MAG: hypothetical protein ACREOZ_04355, partial [Gloeomargaritales cyanobacterium]
MLKSALKDLGHGILKELLACSVLEDAVPDVLRDLRNSIDENCQIHALESNVQDYVTLRRKSGAAIY